MNMTKVDIQAKIYKWLPSMLRRPLNSLRILPTYIRWRMAEDGRRRAKRVLGPLRGRFAGCRCVVIGNGPSLNEMDLSVLRDEFTFGLNRIYLKFPELGFSTSFLVSVNRFVISQFAEEMIGESSLKVFNWRYSRGFLEGRSDVVGLCAKPMVGMNGRILQGYYLGGGTVTNVALELAYFLGFSEVILIGVDHTYERRGDPGKPVVSEKDDRDHFSPRYFGKGVVWQLPNYAAMEEGYTRARRLFEESGRIIVNATVGGNLEVFDRVPSLTQRLNASEFSSRSKWQKLNNTVSEDLLGGRGG